MLIFSCLFFTYTGSSVGTSSPSNLLASPTNHPVRRKRCNTEPTAEFMRTTKTGSSTWSRSRSNSRGKSIDNEEGDGYLMMKPVYEEKLKRQAKGIPQSPIHGAAMSKSTLRRSATVSGEVSAMSPRMNRSLTRERTSTGSTPPLSHSGTLTYRRPRGKSEGLINPSDLPRNTRTDRTKHHYGPALDPSLLKRLTHKLNKFANTQDGTQQPRHDSLPEITTHGAQFTIDPANLSTLNNNIDQMEESSTSVHRLSKISSHSGGSHSVDGSECLPNGYADEASSGKSHDCNANPNDNE